MTKARIDLLGLASRNGYQVVIEGDGTTKITKAVGRWKKANGIVIHPDGTAFDVQAHPSAARGLRSYSAMRAVLGI